MSSGRSGRGGRAGFTLVEVLVASSLSAVLFGLVFSVFFAQNDFYDDVLRRSRAHDDARGVLEQVSADLRSATAAGIVVADSLRVVARVPLAFGTPCWVQPNFTTGYFVQGRGGLDTVAVAGYGIRADDGSWTFHADTWDDMYLGTGQPLAGRCADEGMDTTGLDPDAYLRLDGPGSSLTDPPTVGGTLVIHEALELSIATSQLDPGYRGFFRGPSGGTSVEHASGLGEQTHFRYRLRGEDAFNPSVSSSDLDRINAVRVVVHALQGLEGGGEDRYERTFIRDIPLRNP